MGKIERAENVGKASVKLAPEMATSLPEARNWLADA